MAATDPPGITPAKLRSGAPDALAALCNGRGASVFEYCRRVVGQDDAAELAAEAFAQLRIAILPVGSVTSRDQAEQLLRSVTRRAAMTHLVFAADAGARSQRRAEKCDSREAELLGYLEKTLTAADRAVFVAHIGRCRWCASLLRRLEAGEEAFRIKPDTALPRSVAQDILTALTTAAPVGSHGGDPVAVRDAALMLLAGDGEELLPDPGSPDPGMTVTEETEATITATSPTKSGAGDERTGRGPQRPESRDTGAVRPRPPTRNMPARRASRITTKRLRERLPSFDTTPPSARRSSRLLLGLTRIAALVIVAGVAGILLGMAIGALTGGDASPAPRATSASVPETSSAGANAERLPVEVLSTTAAPRTDEAGGGAIVDVRVRMENASDRTLPNARPQLLVNDASVAVAPDASNSAGRLLLPAFASGDVAVGTLRFELPSTTPRRVITDRIRLRIAGRILVLDPALDDSG